MTLKIGNTARDSQALVTERGVRLQDWIGDSRAVLCSHPKDLTPVDTPELGCVATIRLESGNRNVKNIVRQPGQGAPRAATARELERAVGGAR